MKKSSVAEDVSELLKKRMNRLLEALPGDFEAALLQTETSRFYYLDFDAGDAGTVLVLPHKWVYLIDGRYIESARDKVSHAEVVLEKDLYKQLGEILAEAGVRKVYLENRISLDLCGKVKEKLPNVSVDASPVLSEAITDLRKIKDVEEIGRMRKAQAVTDACFEYILPRIEAGRREIDLALEMEMFMRSHGAEHVAFETIFVSGKNTSLPHGHPGDTTLAPGDLITMDFGAKVQGYCADMTRTVALAEPGEDKREVYDVVLRAHMAGLGAVRGGKAGNEVDAVARKVLEQAGFGENFSHGLGHAVGIEIHEDPRFSPKCSEIVRAGMMMTVEPGCYLAGRFGCRIEDTVLVTEDGCEPLPKSPKELMVL